MNFRMPDGKRANCNVDEDDYRMLQDFAQRGLRIYLPLYVCREVRYVNILDIRHDDKNPYELRWVSVSDTLPSPPPMDRTELERAIEVGVEELGKPPRGGGK